MTCIVGIVENGTVVLGGDSCGATTSNGWLGGDQIVMQQPKVFTNGELVIGYTTSFRMGQLLRFSLAPPPAPSVDDVDRYIHVDVLNAIRKCFADGGFGTVKDVRTEGGGTFLLGYRGRLFKVQEDFAVLESETSYDACGGGAAYALGALHAMAGFGISAAVRISSALSAASYHSTGVKPPFHLERQPAESPVSKES